MKIKRIKALKIISALCLLILSILFSFYGYSILSISSLDGDTFSNGLKAGLFLGFPLFPLINKIRDKKKPERLLQNKWLQISIALLIIALFTAWFLYEPIVKKGGILWIFIQGYIPGCIATAMVYIIGVNLHQK